MWQVDATYKLNWQGYPLLVIGLSDFTKQFHPFGWCLSSGETSKDFEFLILSAKQGLQNIYNIQFLPSFIMGDAAESITNAINRIDSNIGRAMCWYHMITRIDIHLIHIKNLSIRRVIRNDIESIQLAESKEEFNVMIMLFKKKYENSSEDVKCFLKYFFHQWYENLPGWYEGFVPLHPSHNNGLEATNRWIKANQFRDRLPLNEFLMIFLKLPNVWSIERRINGRKQWAEHPNTPLSIWTGACQWSSACKNYDTYTYDKSNGKLRVTSSNYLNITESDIQKYFERLSESSALNLEDFIILSHSMVCIFVSNENKVKCNCKYYKKNYICFHSLGTEILLNLKLAPSEAWAIPLGQKRKRGRPSKAAPALVKM